MRSGSKELLRFRIVVNGRRLEGNVRHATQWSPTARPLVPPSSFLRHFYACTCPVVRGPRCSLHPCLACSESLALSGVFSPWPSTSQTSQYNSSTASPSRPATASSVGGGGSYNFSSDAAPASPAPASPAPASPAPASPAPSTLAGNASAPASVASAPLATTVGLALVPHTHLTHPRRLGNGAFGDVDLAEYVERGLMVAVKCNGTACADAAAIDNERRLYDKLLLHPHDNILPVYGICTDAPDGKVRLVMKYCEKGSLDDYLIGTAKHEVCFVLPTWTHSFEGPKPLVPVRFVPVPVCIAIACALASLYLCRVA
jgi:hypothetical protein